MGTLMASEPAALVPRGQWEVILDWGTLCVQVVKGRLHLPQSGPAVTWEG